MLPECPCFYGPRLCALWNIVGAALDVKRDDVVVTLAAGYEAHKRLVLATAVAVGTQQQRHQQLAAEVAPELRTCGQSYR